jgi:hypothetical protein
MFTGGAVLARGAHLFRYRGLTNQIQRSHRNERDCPQTLFHRLEPQLRMDTTERVTLRGQIASSANDLRSTPNSSEHAHCSHRWFSDPLRKSRRRCLENGRTTRINQPSHFLAKGHAPHTPSPRYCATMPPRDLISLAQQV